MFERIFLWKLFAALLLIGLGVVSISTLILYNTTIDTEVANLQALSQSHAKLINSVAQFDSEFNKDFPDGGSRAATVLQITNAHFEKIGFGETGEFVVGETRNGKIHFLIPSRNLAGEIAPVDPNARAAEPMRRALLGRSGIMDAPDYQGEHVLAWYEPLPDLNAGFVAKINISELRAPFKRAALVGCLIAVVLSGLSCVVFGKIASWSSARANAATTKEPMFGHQALILLSLIGCLTFVGASSVSSVVGLLYSPGIDRQKSELLSLSIGMASLIDSVAEFDAMTSGSGANIDASAATISQVQRSAKTNPGFGNSGEIVLGLLEEGNIEFLLPSRFTGVPSQPVSFSGSNAEPMRRALSGTSGIIDDLDYRGKRVVAAFQPVKYLDAGFVAKMDLEEIRSPYVLTGIINVSLTIFIVLLGTLLAPQIVEGLGRSTVGQFNIGLASARDGEKEASVRRFALPLIIGFAGFVFLLDYLTPLGIAAGIPYIALIIVGSFFLREKGLLALTFLATVLVFVGWAIAPDEGAAFSKVMTNRLLAVFTLWLAAIILLRNIKAEQSIRLSETRIRTIIENTADGIIVITEKGAIQSFSPSAERIFGYPSGEVMEKNIKMLMPEPTRGEHDGYLGRYLKYGDARVVGNNREVIGLRKDGTEFPMDLAVGEATLGDERMFTGIVRDITERKCAEENLREARDEAQAATKAKAAFLATMSHEIRTPMTGVIGMVDMLVHTKLDDDQRQMMRTVRDSAYALLTIINDILDFSKIEAGKLELEAIPFSIRDAVEGTSETLGPNAKNKGVRINIHIDPDIPDAVLGDQVRIRQILFNIGGNAVKFTEKGRVLIRAYPVSTGDEKMATVRFEIIDSGIGISKEAQANLFQEFSQAESSTNRRFGGTGLGLSICQRLTEMMDGKIEVESELGKGSTFIVTLSFPVAEKHKIKSDGHDLSGLNVLFVGEDAEECELDAKYLRHWGAEVTTIGGVGEAKPQALEAAGQGTAFDIIVLGSAWPVETRAAEIKAIQAESNIADTRFVLMTETRTKAERKDISNSVYVESDPLRRAPFIRAVAVAAGRASPDVSYDDDEIVTEAVTAPTIEEAEAAGTLILVAEDNMTNQNVIRRQLNLLGYAADMADDGKQALEAMKSKRYTVLLTDCHMPNMDGFELTAKIRETEKDGDTRLPIIAITASVLAAEIDRCYESGMDDSLAKPLEMPKLKAALRKWMPEFKPADGGEAVEKITQVTDGDGKDFIDPSALKSVFGDDEETFIEILKDFVDPATSNIEEIEAAYANRSADGVANAAHKLKSSSRSVGANELADLCQTLEMAGKAEDWDEIDKTAPRLAGVMHDVAEYIKAL
ncbi:MAG: PAS domain S-box protein [Rhodospirillales bacterium]|nr:PAS domain S-box protein [Rhodospirillales bacterium]